MVRIIKATTGENGPPEWVNKVGFPGGDLANSKVELKYQTVSVVGLVPGSGGKAFADHIKDGPFTEFLAKGGDPLRNILVICDDLAFNGRDWTVRYAIAREE